MCWIAIKKLLTCCQMLNACSCSSVCLLCSLVRRHGSLTKDVSSIITGRPCPPAESAAKSGDVDTQSETDAVNVRHEDYGTTGTTSLQASQHRKHASRLCASLNMHTHFLNSHFEIFLSTLFSRLLLWRAFLFTAIACILCSHSRTFPVIPLWHCPTMWRLATSLALTTSLTT